MSDPMRVFKLYLQQHESMTSHDNFWFELGISAMALQIVTWIKTLERLPVTTDVGRQEAIVAMQTLLNELGLWDSAIEVYEKLAEWRRPKFRVEHDASQRGNDGVV